jgi:gluconolactonase
MKIRRMWLLCGAAVAAACLSGAFTESVTAESAARIVRADPGLDALIAPDAVVERLAGGFQWTEGPVWDRKNNWLLFSDIPNNVINKWTQAAGVSVFLKPSGYTGSTPYEGREPGSNGLAFDAQGRLVVCDHGNRRVARIEADGTRTTLADRYEGKRFNSPNDLVYRSNGDLYFTDPPYGLPQTFEDRRRELDFCGVYRLPSGGKPQLLTREISAPNGIAFSPDEKRLYVACSDPKRAVWMVYDVNTAGAITNGKVFFDATAWVPARKGLPDGMKVDTRGNLFAAGPGGVNIFSPAGKLLGTIDTGVPTANCAFGNDGSTLYITADTTLLRVKVRTKGLGYK